MLQYIHISLISTTSDFVYKAYIEDLLVAVKGRELSGSFNILSLVSWEILCTQADTTKALKLWIVQTYRVAVEQRDQ